MVRQLQHQRELPEFHSRQGHDRHEQPGAGFLHRMVRVYGVERAIYVLSRTVQFSDWDSRFDQAVLDRAGQTDFPDARTPRDENHVDPTTRYVTEIDPCVANAIFMKLMELEEEQEAIAQMENDGQKELDEDMALEM